MSAPDVKKNESYVLHPRSPLVFGSGRPSEFGLGGDSLQFPFPSTVAGALRAASEVAEGRPANPYKKEAGTLNWLSLAQFDWLDPDATLEGLLPSPADATYLNGKLLRLVPEDVPANCISDLPKGLKMLTLKGDGVDLKGKPDEAPPWWTARDFAMWLANPALCVRRSTVDTKVDVRTHVTMNSGKGSENGQLFRSAGRDFAPERCSTIGFALATGVSREGNSKSLHGHTRRLGGEGRFVRIESAPENNALVPLAPEKLVSASAVRVVLITPAIFEKYGWHPDFLDPVSFVGKLTLPENKNIELKMIAAAIPRAQSYSGWQFDKEHPRGQPGQPWRVVPAGSVYWFEVTKGNAANLWAESLCTEQWKVDGWGIGLVGVV